MKQTTDITIDREYLGHVLIKQGFETWFRYMFRVIEQKPFIMEAIHAHLFKGFQCLYDRTTKRLIINIPPRSGKTTLAKYFLIYCITLNPRCNFIYTSYSQELLALIAQEMAAIMEHSVYKAMYPGEHIFEEVEADPVDEFWKDYLIETDKKNKYTNKRIVTRAGGVLLFASVGASITGFGAGIRGSKHFSGALIIDDANKPADITSQLMRDKVYRYYYETLLTRLNDSNVAICNIQQRLHVEDLSGYLMKEYDFEVIRQPLIDEQGQCQVPSQYTKERIKELRINESTWLAQYQQTPIAEKGQIIQRQWWKYYEREAINQDRTPKYPIKGAIIMTADTAYKKGKDNDLSCIQVWEIARGVMRMREMIVGRWNFPELLQKAKYIWAKWTDPNKPPAQRAKYFFIEDKASGTSLEQTLTVEGIEAIAWKPKDFDYPDDKVGRMREASFDVFKGMIELPYGDPMTEYLVNEAALFSEDDSHAHDDSCDAFTMAHSIWRHYGGNQ